MSKKKRLKPKKLSQNYMDVIYKHNKKWTMNEKSHVEVEMEHTGFTNRVAQKFFKRPEVSQIELDEYGTIVWQSLDGKRTVHEVLQIMEQKLPNEQDRMLDRVVTFLSTLESNHFIIKTED